MREHPELDETQELIPLSELLRPQRKVSLRTLYPYGVRQIAEELAAAHGINAQICHDTAWRIIEMHDGKPRQVVAGDRNNPLVMEHIARPLAEIDAEIAELEAEIAQIGAMRSRLRALPPGQIIEGEAHERRDGLGAATLHNASNGPQEAQGMASTPEPDWEAKRQARNARARDKRLKWKKNRA